MGMLALTPYFFFWYLGNYYYNIQNKLALKACGGADGFPLTIATLQLGVGMLYALYLWAAPDVRKVPKVTMSDIVTMLPVAFCSAAAHSASVFAMGAGAVSFAQIVKASEPVFAAVINTFVYGKTVSKPKWMCLPIIVGGVSYAALKKNAAGSYEFDFEMSALASAALANVFAAFKGSENKKVMDAPGLKDRIGGVGNQFAISTILAFLISVPLALALEGHKFDQFVTVFKNDPVVFNNVMLSGMTFYLYNELATMTIKQTGPVMQSVMNTAKRAIVIVGVAVVMGEALPPSKLIGCSIAIGGVFLYSIADKLFPAKAKKN